MENKTMNVKELTKTTAETTANVRYRTQDGLVFVSREEYLDYVRGLRN